MKRHLSIKLGLNLGITLILASSAMADQTPSERPLTPCKLLRRSSSQVGDRCATTSGHVYERIAKEGFGEAWKDPSGLIWSDRIGTSNQFSAEEFCERIGGTLPGEAQFRKAERREFREILPRMNFYWYWSATEVDEKTAYGFRGTTGEIQTEKRNDSNSVRCVSMVQ